MPWFERYGPEALRQLPFKEKLIRPMAAAAASGSEANLAAVWGLVRQGLHPELLRDRYYNFGAGSDSAVTFLVREGHAHLLPWLLDSGYPVDAEYAFLAAAQYCDLAGLQTAWQLLLPQLAPFHGLRHDALEWAAGSPTAKDAVAKMEWLLQQHEEAGAVLDFSPTVAAVAAGTGDLIRLRWMLQRGCDFNAYGNELDDSGRVLPTPMWRAGLEVVEWLVREAGCQLPEPAPGLGPAAAAAEEEEEVVDEEGDVENYRMCLVAAASGSTAKLQWLRDRGLLQSLPPAAMQDVLSQAAVGGQLGAMHYLHQECGVGLPYGAACAAVRSGDAATAAWVLQQGGRELFADQESMWHTAVSSGSVNIVRWLIGQGMVGTLGHVEDVTVWLVRAWPSETQQQRASLLPVVQLVMQSLGGGPSASGGGGGSAGSGGSSDGSGLGGNGGDGGLAPGATTGERQRCHELLAAAAGRGSLPLFTYLHSQLQCPLGPDVLLQAVESGCEALVEWLLGHGCAIPEDTRELFAGPASDGDLATIRCLRRLAVPWPQGLLADLVTRGCHLPMLRWLVAEGVPAGAREVAEAVEAAMSVRQLGFVDERRQQVDDVEAWLRGLGFR